MAREKANAGPARGGRDAGDQEATPGDRDATLGDRDAIIERIRESLKDATGANSRIALWILENTQEVGFLSIKAVSDAIGVSEPSVLRFAKALGFEGFADFKRAIQAAIRLQLNPRDRTERSEFGSSSAEERARRLMRCEEDNVAKTFMKLDMAALERVAGAVAEADRVYMCGIGASRYIIEMFELLFTSNLPGKFFAISGSLTDYFPRFNDYGKRDVLVALSMPSYSKETTQIANFAKGKKGKVFLITDSPRCPVYPIADEVLLCSNASLISRNSFIGPIAVLQVLMNLLILDNGEGPRRRRTGR